MAYIYQHVVFGSIIPSIDDYELREAVINDTGVVKGFYNGNRLDDEGYFIGIKLKTLDQGSNFNLSEFISEFLVDKEVHMNTVHKLIAEFKESESLKSFDTTELFNLIKEPQLFIIPESE